MSLLIPHKLSNLVIDVSKNWAAEKIENLGAPDSDDDASRRDTIVSLVEAAGLALASGKNIKLISALTANDTWSGLSAVLTAGEVLALGEAVYLKAADSEVYKTLATATATMPGIALATCPTTDGNPFEFLLLGFMRHDAWTWTAGGLLYIDRTTAGALTQTAPATTGDQVQVVGVAITADIILFNPSYELVEIS